LGARIDAWQNFLNELIFYLTTCVIDPYNIHVVNDMDIVGIKLDLIFHLDNACIHGDVVNDIAMDAGT
jgi:hypothetical protein